MSQMTSMKLQNRKVTNVQVTIHPERRPTEKAPLKVSFQVKLGLPKEQAEHSFLLACTMRAISEQAPDFFDATLEVDYVFLCSEAIESCKDAIETQGVPLAQERTMELLKAVLADMGYEKFFKE